MTKIFSMSKAEKVKKSKKLISTRSLYATPEPTKAKPAQASSKRTVKNFRLFGDRVLIEQEEAKKDINGIIIPESAKNKPARGKILKVGPKVLDAKAGETVYFGKYAGTVIPLNEGEELLILREADVFMADGNA